MCTARGTHCFFDSCRAALTLARQLVEGTIEVQRHDVDIIEAAFDIMVRGQQYIAVCSDLGTFIREYI